MSGRHSLHERRCHRRPHLSQRPHPVRHQRQVLTDHDAIIPQASSMPSRSRFWACSSHSARAQDAAPETAESRLRDALRSTMLQLRDAQGQVATLQASQAQSDKDNAELKAKIDTLDGPDRRADQAKRRRQGRLGQGHRRPEDPERRPGHADRQAQRRDRRLGEGRQAIRRDLARTRRRTARSSPPRTS